MAFNMMNMSPGELLETVAERQDRKSRSMEKKLNGSQDPMAVPELSKDEEEGLGRRVARQGMGALSWVGESLMKPMAAVEGVAGGLLDLAQGNDPKWGGGLLNLIPYSDTLGITDPDKRTYGRDILERVGLEKNEPGLDLGDVAGFGLDLALDPTTYLTFGASAIGKAGRALKGAGVLDRYLSRAARAANMGTREYRMTHTAGNLLDYAKAVDPHRAAQLDEAFTRSASSVFKNPTMSVNQAALGAAKNERIGGLLGVGLPFAKPIDTIGSGAVARKAAKWMDDTGEAIRWSAPVRYAKSMFDHSVFGRYDKTAQLAAEKIGYQLADESVRQEIPILQMIDEVARDPRHANRYREHRMLAEGVAGVNAMTPAEQKLYQTLDTVNKEELRRFIESGGAIDALQDPYTDFAARIRPEDISPTINHGGKGGYGYDPSGGRELLLKQGKKGTEDFNDVMKDLDVRHEATKQIQDPHTGLMRPQTRDEAIVSVTDKIRQKYGNTIDDYMRLMEEGKAKYVAYAKDPNAANGLGKVLADDFALNTSQVVDYGGNLWAPHRIDYDVATLGGVKDHATGNLVDAVLIPKSVSRHRQLAIEFMNRPEYWKEGIFPNHVLIDTANAIKANKARRGRWDMMTEMLSSHAPDVDAGFTTSGGTIRNPMNGASAVAQSENGKLEAFFAAQGMDPERAAWIVNNKRATNNIPGFSMMPEKPKIETYINNLPPNPTQQQVKAAEKQFRTDRAAWNKQISPILNEYVKPEKWNDLRVWNRNIELPEALETARNVWKSLTSVFKAGVLTWPARYTRDFVSMNARLAEQGILSAHDVTQAAKLFAGQAGENLHLIPAVADTMRQLGYNVTNPNPEEASAAFRYLYSAYNNPAYRIETEAGTNASRAITGIEDAKKRIVGADKTTVGGILKDMWTSVKGQKTPDSSWWKAWQNRGWHENMVGAPLSEPKFGLSQAGDTLGSMADNIPRVAGFLNLLRKGVNPADAAKQIAYSLVDFNPAHFTPAERLLKDIIPFYSFSSRAAPYALKELIERPGGRMAATIKATTMGRNPDVMTPDFVSSTTAIPFGRQEDGTQRYITGAGLMHEDPMAWANILRFKPMMALTELISRLNPLIKGPAEYASNRVFFQSGPHGPRSADDADPLVGRFVANIGDYLTGQKTGQVKPIFNSPLTEMVVSNSPASRLMTTMRTLTDQRKWQNPSALVANLLTGVRMADVSPEAQEGIMREQLAGEMKDLGAREFSRIRFTADQMKNMTPKQQQEALLFNYQQNLLAKRAKKRAEEKKLLSPYTIV